MKLSAFIGLVLFGIMTALPALAGSAWTANTSCVYVTVTGGSLDGAGEVPCKVKYTPWSIYSQALEEWDISFGGEVFEIVRTAREYRMSAERLTYSLPVNYSSGLEGYNCWVDATSVSPAFILCYQYK